MSLIENLTKKWGRNIPNVIIKAGLREIIDNRIKELKIQIIELKGYKRYKCEGARDELFNFKKTIFGSEKEVGEIGRGSTPLKVSSGNTKSKFGEQPSPEEASLLPSAKPEDLHKNSNVKVK